MLFLLLMGVGGFCILQQILYKKYWNRKLGIVARFETHAVYEGDTAFLREEITNDKLLPLPVLEVNLAVDRALKFSGEAKENANVTDQSYRRDIFSLFARQKVIRRLPFVCGKRGRQMLSDMTFSSAKAFMMTGCSGRLYLCIQSLWTAGG